MRPLQISLVVLSAFGVLYSCENFEPDPRAADSLLDGPVDGLSEAENLQFLRGDIAFNDEVFTTETGLGPLFVAGGR